MNGGKILSMGHASLSGAHKINKSVVTRHAEMDAIWKLASKDSRKLRGATVWSIRWGGTNNTDLKMARPCAHCHNLMKKYHVKKCVYSSWNGDIRCEQVGSMSCYASTGTRFNLRKNCYAC